MNLLHCIQSLQSVIETWLSGKVSGMNIFLLHEIMLLTFILTLCSLFVGFFLLTVIHQNSRLSQSLLRPQKHCIFSLMYSYFYKQIRLSQCKNHFLAFYYMLQLLSSVHISPQYQIIQGTYCKKKAFYFVFTLLSVESCS